MNAPYKIGSLSRLTGFSPAVLRAWERRYGLLAPARGTGSQREYGDDDLRVLRYVRRQLDLGRSIGEVASPGRATLVARAAAEPVEADPRAAAATGEGLEAWRGALVRAAQTLDGAGVSAVLEEVFAVLGPVRAVDDIVIPVAIEVGDLWAAGRCSVAGEHLISDQFLHRVRRLLDAAQPSGNGAPRVIAACFPDEQHQLGLAILAWRLARPGVRVVYLGAAVPLDDLVRGWQAAQPDALLLSVTRTATLEAHAAELHDRAAREMPGAAVFVGGQGVSAVSNVEREGGGVTFLAGTPEPDVVERILARVA